jgi:hypothetical protein
MCGRYSITNTTEAYRRLFSFDDLTGLQPRYNLAPTQMAPVIRERDGARHLDMLRWGLLPKWSKDESEGAKMINARSETIAENRPFAMPFAPGAVWFQLMDFTNGRPAARPRNRFGLPAGMVRLSPLQAFGKAG